MSVMPLLAKGIGISLQVYKYQVLGSEVVFEGVPSVIS